eukprot:9970159-Karenia_brevis.AAC.1
MDPPYECHQLRKGASRSVYVPLFDLGLPDVRRTLVWKIKNGFYRYIHFGVPCSTWGPAGWLNHETRRKGREEGDGTLHREKISNELVAF